MEDIWEARGLTVTEDSVTGPWVAPVAGDMVLWAAPVAVGNGYIREDAIMKSKKFPSVKLCSAICALLMAILLILQFVPYWELDGQQVSIGGYIWFPSEHADLTAHFQEMVSPDFKVDSLVLSSILQMAIPVAGIIFFMHNRESIFAQICTAACGLVGLWSYLSKPAFQLGTNWYFNLILAAVLLAAAIISIFVRYKHVDLKGKEV